MSSAFYSTFMTIVAGVVLIGLVSIVYRSWRNGISPMPSSSQARMAVSTVIGRMSGPIRVIEAGSGWGHLALHIAEKCKGSTVEGVENASLPLWTSQLARFALWRSNVTFRRGDIYKEAYEQADVIVCYLYPGAMKRLSGIFKEKAKPGARIISVCFALPDWPPHGVIVCSDVYRTPVYLYDVPNRIHE
ncbi:class I SAM-dependent methyltransferase [Paenibacillus sp. YIM B09110]|uniref:class I SAM-dependent methyltransferase n=1 Tax=Paenibacillus sp. YIM B09110 TaxID=3126102 RepID=UPI00301C5D37